MLPVSSAASDDSSLRPHDRTLGCGSNRLAYLGLQINLYKKVLRTLEPSETAVAFSLCVSYNTLSTGAGRRMGPGVRGLSMPIYLISLHIFRIVIFLS